MHLQGVCKCADRVLEQEVHESHLDARGVEVCTKNFIAFPSSAGHGIILQLVQAVWGYNH